MRLALACFGTLIACVLLVPSTASALEIERGEQITTIHVTEDDGTTQTSARAVSSDDYYVPNLKLPSTTDGWPILQIAPDLFGTGWFACDRCGAPITTPELVVRADRPIVLTVEDPGSLDRTVGGLRIRLEGTSTTAADGSTLQLFFDRGSVVRDDVVRIRDGQFDIGGDGSVELDTSAVSPARLNLWTGGGDDRVDATGAGIASSSARWFANELVGARSHVDLGAGNDTLIAGDELSDTIALGQGDDRLTLTGTKPHGEVVTTDGGRDTVDASRSAATMQVTARTQDALDVTTGSARSMLRSYARKLTVDASRSMGVNVDAVARTATVRGSRSSDFVNLQGDSTHAKFRVDLGAGNDVLSTRSAAVLGTLGAGSDTVDQPQAKWNGGEFWAQGSLRGLSCGRGVDTARTPSAGVDGCERHEASGEWMESGEDDLRRRLHRWNWDGWDGQPLASWGDDYGIKSVPAVVASDVGTLVLRTESDAMETLLHRVVRDGIASWSCGPPCDDAPPGTPVELQIQHPTKIHVRDLLATGPQPPPLTIRIVGARGALSRLVLAGSGGLNLRATNDTLSIDGAPVVRFAGGRVAIAEVYATGSGSDRIDLSDADLRVSWVVKSGLGRDRIVGSPWHDSITAAGTAVVDGGPGNDSIRAAGRGSIVHGGAGDDSLSGGPRIAAYGDAGNDSLGAGHGSSVLDGGIGDDVLHGEYGADTMRGGPGDDLFTKRRGTLRVDGGPGEDVIGPKATVTVLDANCGPDLDAIVRAPVHQRGCETTGTDWWYDQRFRTLEVAGKPTLTYDDPHWVSLPPDWMD